MKEYGQMPNGEVIMNHYKDYMDGHDLADDDRKMLFRFFHEIVGCVNLLWKEKSLKSGTFSKVTTTSDEAFAFFIMRDYAKITTKQDRKQVKLAGENLENAIQFFEEKMTEIKQMKKEHSGRITQLDDDIREYIKKKYACKKRQRRREEDESTIESNPRISKPLKNLFDFDDLCEVDHTPV
jgi:hypothetical protein